MPGLGSAASPLRANSSLGLVGFVLVWLSAEMAVADLGGFVD